MGWVVYRLTRSSGGQIAWIFPKVDSQFTIDQTKSYTLSELLEYPDFPIEANSFSVGSAVDRLQKFGFGNVVNALDYVGEDLTLDNGAKIQILPYEKNGAAVNFYYPDGTSWGGYGFIPRDKDGSFVWGPGLIGNNMEGSFGGGTIDTDSFPVKFNFGVNPYPSPDTFPTTIRPLKFFAGAKPIYAPKDPYEEGGESGTGGGTGSFSGTGDSIAIPSLPTLSATDAGFITLFNPTLSEMHSLASYMWSDLFDMNGWKKIFADPMGAILGLSIVPVNVPSGGAKEVSVGNISTGVSMTVAASQYVEVDCGTLNVEEYWGAYLDYEPYTKAEIYLPYIGIHPIATDDIMGKSVHVVYHVDILSGSCCAYVQCGGTILYSFIGQCSSSIPITGDNWTNVINGAISIAGSIGTMVATGGASAPMAIGQIASTAVNAMKPSVEKSGAMGGTGGMLGVQTPYLILTRPRQALPRLQNTFTGYPSFINEYLGDLEGYTEVESIHLENVPATESELSEIENLLKGGVIF